ncbi:hypothetical protein EC973_001000 [Apophysomyces ossiformis]|uniref:Rho GTPase activation protein n=1 Tax=Apophysomyces ossiformis TaxID=679940 RepID=A0A8H7BYJ9_9FUNG|nr:hypothetical protein EC973_001000 [Apophysomyces ossiformis]
MTTTYDWVEIVDPASNHVFYAKPTTGECLWERPSTGIMKPRDPEGDWWELWDEKHQLPYFYNTQTGVTEWDRPADKEVIPLIKIQSSSMLGKRVSLMVKEPEELPTHKDETRSLKETKRNSRSLDLASTNGRLRPRLHHRSTSDGAAELHDELLHERSAAKGSDSFSAVLAPSTSVSSGVSTTTSLFNFGLGKMLSPPTSSAYGSGGRPRRLSHFSAFSNFTRSSKSTPGHSSTNPLKNLVSRSTASTSRNSVAVSAPINNPEAAISMHPLHHQSGDEIIPPPAPAYQKPALPAGLRQDINQFAIDGFAKKYFSTHKRGLFRRRVPMTEMLQWTKVDDLQESLKQPLIMLNKDLYKDVLRCFKLIQMIMGDRPRPRNTNAIEDIQTILSCGITKGQMRDEIYVQICKQLHNNPSRDSVRKGWEILCVVSVTFPPSKNLETYLNNFVEEHHHVKDNDLDIMSRHVSTKLKRICVRGAKGKVLTAAEIERAKEAPFKPSVFGESLEFIMSLQNGSGKIPKIVPFLADAVHQMNGQRSEGIFRVPGDADAVTDLRVRVENGNYDATGITDPNVPASLLKYWLRDLADPLISAELYSKCIACAENAEKAIEIVNALPEVNRRIVLYMISFIQEFTDPEVIKHTLMNVSNLAMVFAPNFLRCPSESLTTVFENSKRHMDPSRYWEHHYPHSPTHRSPVLPQRSITTVALQDYEFQLPGPRKVRYEGRNQRPLAHPPFDERHLPSSQDSSSSSVIFESASPSTLMATSSEYHPQDKFSGSSYPIRTQHHQTDDEDGEEEEEEEKRGYRHGHSHEQAFHDSDANQNEEEEEERRGYRKEQHQQTSPPPPPPSSSPPPPSSSSLQLPPPPQERAESANQFSVWEEYQPDYRMLNESYQTMKEDIYKDIYDTMEKLHTLEVGFEDAKGEFHARIEQDYQQLSLELMEKRTRLAKQRMSFVEESERMVQDDRNGFSIDYRHWYKVVTNHLNNETYALVCCNQTLNTSSGYHAIVNVPLKQVAVNDILPILAYIELLGLNDSVVSIAGYQNVTSPCYGNITDQPSLPSTKIDAVFAQQTNTNLGIPILGFPIDQDSLSPIQKAAWLMFVGAFFDKEAYGSIVFQNIQNNYACHKANLAEVTHKKSMAWTVYDTANQLWKLEATPYAKQLTADAETNASAQFPFITADIVLDRTPRIDSYKSWLTLAGVNASQEQFIIDRNVFRTDGLVNLDGYSDWPQRSPARPDLALADLIHVAYPTYDPTYTFAWMRNFAKLDSPRPYRQCGQASSMPICVSHGFRNDNQTEANQGRQPTLSAGEKAGIAVGVIVVILGAVGLIGGWWAYRRGLLQPNHTFYKMKEFS